MNRDPQWLQVWRISDYRTLGPKGTFASHLCHQGSGILAEEGQRVSGPEAMADCKKTVSPGHRGAVTHRHSQKCGSMCEQAQATTNAGVERRDGYRAPPLAKKLLTIDISWEE